MGRQFIFSGHELTPAARDALTPAKAIAYRSAEAHAVQIPYTVIAVTVLVVALLVALTRFPAAATRTQRGSPFGGLGVLLRSRMFLFGVAAQFFYVGTQIGVWSFLIRYAQQAVAGMPEQRAASYLVAALMCFLVARFVNLLLLRRYSSAQIGMVFAAAAAVLTATAILLPGPVGIAALVGTSFFMSIMFPAIYAIGLHGHAEQSQPASALMIMSITGGAVLTAAMGAISDHATIAAAYSVPLIGFLVVLAYCVAAVRSGRTGPAAAMPH